ncbi:MAG: hypothetical protein KDK97_09780 [Verrucomicrobiales bacterium]|nr:hypothetical protein [Verrucomicrobiales bacterium]MCP5556975.1 hypothetical protein [Verrucomicrobiaceae bacterium]
MKVSYVWQSAVFIYLLIALDSRAQSALESWVLSDGTMIEAKVRTVAPGHVLFTQRSGIEKDVEISKLSERSRKRLLEVLGFSASDAAALPAGTPTPMATVPAAPVAPSAPANGSAIDVTDTASIEASFGKEATVAGQVKKIITLGAAGHKLVEFDGSTFQIFVSNSSLQASNEWALEDMVGKRVQASGKVDRYRDNLQLRISRPDQIAVVQ